MAYVLDEANVNQMGIDLQCTYSVVIIRNVMILLYVI